MSAEQTPEPLSEQLCIGGRCDYLGYRTHTQQCSEVTSRAESLLAAAVREAEQRALREAADAMPFGYSHAAYMLRDRADRITEPASHEAATSGEEASKA